MISCKSKNQHQKTMYLQKKKLITHSVYPYNSKPNSHHDGGLPYVILTNTIIFTFHNKKNKIHMISKNHEENGYGHDLDLLLTLH